MKCRLCANPLGDESYCPRCGGSVPPEEVPASERSLVGRKVCGRYQVLDLIRVGGMGTVYLARCDRTGDEVALKAIHARLMASPESVSRFTLEAEIATHLDHPNIIQATDAGYERDCHFLVMQYIEGMDLSRVLRYCSRLPIADVCEIGRQVEKRNQEASRPAARSA